MKSLAFPIAFAALLVAASCGGKAVIDGEDPTSQTTTTSSTGTGVSSQRECDTSADCTLSNSCCGCSGYPVGTPDPDANCAADCEQPFCDAFGDTPRAICVRGQCTTDVDCGGNVFCDSGPPNCGPGRVPSTINDCWGPCIDAVECRRAFCGGCPSNTYCLGTPGATHCIPQPPCDHTKCSCVSDDRCEGTELCVEDLGAPDIICGSAETD